MNIAYVLAVAILDGAALLDQFTPTRIDADDIWDLIPRITARHREAFDAHPSGRGQTRVCVRFTDGTTLESYQFAARSILSPLSNADIVSKYRALTEHVLDRDRQDDLHRAIMSIDTSPDLTNLSDLLAAPVTSPFTTEAGDAISLHA